MSQTKPNKKCMGRAPVRFWIFPPILMVGNKGPLFPPRTPPQGLVHSLYTGCSNLHHLCSLPPPRRRRPDFFCLTSATEDVAAPRKCSGFRSPNLLPHLAPPPGHLSQAGRVLSAQHWPRPALDPRLPAALGTSLHCSLAPSLSPIFHCSLSPGFFHSGSRLLKIKKPKPSPCAPHPSPATVCLSSRRL